MSSESYLKREARWAREQQAKSQRRLDDLADQRELRLMRDHADLKALRARVELREALRARGDLHERLPEHREATERDVDRWRVLAEEYEKRIADSEDEPMWADQ